MYVFIHRNLIATWLAMLVHLSVVRLVVISQKLSKIGPPVTMEYCLEVGPH